MEKFGITLTAKLRHAALWEAVKKCGSQSALAKQLGISASEIGLWINLKRVPSEKCGKVVEKALYELTGQTLDELFPKELRENTEFLQHEKSLEVTREVETRMLGCQAAERLLLPGADVEAIGNLDREELGEALKKALETLSYREREIIKMRLSGMRYAEIAKLFKVTKSRVSQVEFMAILLL